MFIIKTRPVVLTAIVIWACLSIPAAAQSYDGEIELSDGTRFWGLVTVQGGQVILVDRNGVRRTFDRRSVQITPLAKLLKYFEREADEIKDEEDDDVDDYLELLSWCKEHGLFQEAAQIALRILKEEPDNARAQLDLIWAREHFDSKGNASRLSDSTVARDWLLSRADIQKIRFALVRTYGPTDKVSVVFRNKALTRFLQDPAGGGTFTTRAQRGAFMRLRKHEQLQAIKRTTGTKYQKDIEIRTDPQIIRQFRKQVLPVATRSCGTVQCHGGEAGDFKLRSGKRGNTSFVYTNFYLLDTYGSGNSRLIDRAKPQESLLLVYGLRTGLAAGLDQRQERADHPVPIDKLPFKSPSDRRYQQVLRWIDSLDPTSPDYGISVSSDSSQKKGKAPAKTSARRRSGRRRSGDKSKSAPKTQPAPADKSKPASSLINTGFEQVGYFKTDNLRGFTFFVRNPNKQDIQSFCQKKKSTFPTGRILKIHFFDDRANIPNVTMKYYFPESSDQYLVADYFFNPFNNKQGLKIHKSMPAQP